MSALYFQVLVYLFALVGLLAVLTVAALWTSDLWAGDRSER